MHERANLWLTIRHLWNCAPSASFNLLLSNSEKRQLLQKSQNVFTSCRWKEEARGILTSEACLTERQSGAGAKCHQRKPILESFKSTQSLVLQSCLSFQSQCSGFAIWGTPANSHHSLKPWTKWKCNGAKLLRRIILIKEQIAGKLDCSLNSPSTFSGFKAASSREGGVSNRAEALERYSLN